MNANSAPKIFKRMKRELSFLSAWLQNTVETVGFEILLNLGLDFPRAAAHLPLLCATSFLDHPPDPLFA